jgi:hypothetical protein
MSADGVVLEGKVNLLAEQTKVDAELRVKQWAECKASLV